MQKNDYSNTDIVIYHGKCPDGVAAAWCFWQAFSLDRVGKSDVLTMPTSAMTVQIMPTSAMTVQIMPTSAMPIFHPGKFEETPPDVTNKNVVFVDFTYPLKTMLDLSSRANTITVLDHHKSALPLLAHNSLRFVIKLDMKRSGAQIAWDETNVPDKAELIYTMTESQLADHSKIRPWFINDIGDRDLWEWKIDGSKNTTRAMYGLGYYESIEEFDKIKQHPRSHYLSIGEVLNKDDDKMYTALASQAIDCIATSPVDNTKTWKVRLVSCYHSHASELGNRLVADGLCDFAVLYRYDILRNEWWLSCRASNKTSIDLVPILRQFDEKSGGHAKAAGMSLKQPLLNYFKPADKRFTDVAKNLSKDFTMYNMAKDSSKESEIKTNETTINIVIPTNVMSLENTPIGTVTREQLEEFVLVLNKEYISID